MTVPWPNESCVLSRSPEKSGPATTRPARSGTGLTPVSRTATVTPAPAVPPAHAALAPEVSGYVEATAVPSYDASLNCTAESGVTAAIHRLRDSGPSWSTGTEAATPSTMGRLRRIRPPTARTAAAAAGPRPGMARTSTRCGLARPASCPARAGVGTAAESAATATVAAATARPRRPVSCIKGCPAPPGTLTQAVSGKCDTEWARWPLSVQISWLNVRCSSSMTSCHRSK